MKSVCLYFNVHLPFRLKKYQQEDIAVIHSYEDGEANKTALDYAAENCYLPANEILLKHLQSDEYSFQVCFSLSGIMLEMLVQYRPDVISSFQQLVNTGKVDILAETYYHSLSYLHSVHEFQRQVEEHTALVKEIFGITPVVFRNTALIYNNGLARIINNMGYKGILCEGVGRILKERSPNHIYAAPENGDFGLLLRNKNLSDDIAFRFSDTDWQEYPLTAGKYASWLHNTGEGTEVINLFMGYETFGVHKPAETGILNFLDELPGAVLANPAFRFSLPSVVLDDYYPRDIYDVPQPVSWQDDTGGSQFSNQNPMQHNTLKKIYDIENMVTGCGNAAMISTWGKLQAADHFYCMTDNCLPYSGSQYLNPFTNATEAFQNYTNIVVDFEISVIQENINISRQKAQHHLPAFNLY